MGIHKIDDVVAWRGDQGIHCLECGDYEGALPITEFDEDEIAVCDSCHQRIDIEK